MHTCTLQHDAATITLIHYYYESHCHNYAHALKFQNANHSYQVP